MRQLRQRISFDTHLRLLRLRLDVSLPCRLAHSLADFFLKVLQALPEHLDSVVGRLRVASHPVRFAFCEWKVALLPP